MKNKKLSLNKRTVANLNDDEMKKLWGGTILPTFTDPPTSLCGSQCRTCKY